MDSERRMDPALYKAATQGDVESLRKLVDPEHPSILSSTTPQLNTALHLAAVYGHAQFAGEVLDRNEELLVARNDDGDTPLHLAAKAGRLEEAELLIRHALAWPQDRKSPLIMTNKAGNTALHEAVRTRRAAVAMALLDADPARGHDLNDRMESPLHMAAREGLVQVVQSIVDYPWVDQEFLPSVSLSGTALHQAVLGTHHRIVEILLDKRPQLIDFTDADGNNALHYAAQKNHSQAVKLLLDRRPGLAYQLNAERQTPLHVAALHGSTDFIKALLRQFPDAAEMVDSRGRNAIHAAAASGKARALRRLLRSVHHAELLNRADSDGNTPLHLAILKNQVQCALLLRYDRRVDSSVRNRDGQTTRSLIEARFSNTLMDAYEAYLWNKLREEEIRRLKRRRLTNKDFDSVVDAYFLAATLIATVTFAATFTMPGGYDQTSGITLHAHNTGFRIFVVSNTVAMCSSIVVIFLLIWARQEPLELKVHNLFWSQVLTIIACLSMLLSLVTTVYVTVAPKALWPAYAVIAIAICSPALFFFITWAGRRSMSRSASIFEIHL